MAKYLGNFPFLCLSAHCALSFVSADEATEMHNVFYWHCVLGHTSSINPGMTTLPMNITNKNRDLFCNICVMGKSVHHVPKPHGSGGEGPQKKKRCINPCTYESVKQCR